MTVGEGTDISIDMLEDLRALGDLGPASLWTGRDRLHDRQVLVVVFDLDADGHIEAFRQRYRSVTTVSRVSSPYTTGKASDGRQYFVLPSSEGLILADDLADNPATDRDLGTPAPPTLAQLRDFYSSLCAVVAELHDHDCAHGFIDPRLITRTRAWRLASLGGIELGLFGDRAVLGAQLDTAYRPPEQAVRADPTTDADIYSLGMILRDLADLAGVDLDQVVNRATAANPADRHVSTHDLVSDANEHLAQAIASGHTSSATRPIPPFVEAPEILPRAADPPAAPVPAAAPASPPGSARRPESAVTPGPPPRRSASIALSMFAGIAIGAIAIGGYVLLSGSNDDPATQVLVADSAEPEPTEVTEVTEVTDAEPSSQATVEATAPDAPAAADQAAVPLQTAVPLGTAVPIGTAVPTETAVPEPAPTRRPIPTARPQPPAINSRPAILYADPANLRSRPTVGSDLVVSLVGQRSTTLNVLSPITNGWYQVEHRDGSGWLFGAFVLPPDDGYLVVEHRDGLGESIILLNESGAELGDNPTANVALVSDTSGPLWEVLLPSGRAAWIDPDLVDVR